MSSHKAEETLPWKIPALLQWMLLQGFWHSRSMAYCSWQVLLISINCSAGNFSSVFTAYQKQCAIFSWDHNTLYIHLASIPRGCHNAELAFPLQSIQAKLCSRVLNLHSSGTGWAGSLLSFPVTCKRLFWTSEKHQHPNYLQDDLSWSGIPSTPSACSVDIVHCGEQ